MKLEVSIIVPVYNGQQTLERCLRSVSNQSYHVREIIVVDNNSVDQTKEIIQRMSREDQRIRYAFEEIPSRGAARNRGIELAKGDIIAMTDCDCIVPENWIEGLLKPIIFESEDMVMGYQDDLIKNHWTSYIHQSHLRYLEKFVKGNYIDVLDTKNFAVRSSVLKELQFDSSMKNSEDFEFSLRNSRRINIRYIPEVKVGHFHKSTLGVWLRLNFQRGYWMKIACNKNREKRYIRKEMIIESVKLSAIFLRPLLMISDFLKNPIRESYFFLVTDYAWMLGLYYPRQ